MSTVRMPPILRQAVGGAREVDATGGTVRELLDDLTSRFPAIKGHLFDDGPVSFQVGFVAGHEIPAMAAFGSDQRFFD